MINWLLIPELFSLILIVIIMLFFREKRRRYGLPNQNRRLYWCCLWLSLLSVVLNMVCVYAIQYSQWIPLQVNLLLNSAYFMTCVLMSTAIALYLRSRILEYTCWNGEFSWAVTILVGVAVVYGGLLIWNLSSGVIFSFDASGGYCRGSLNQIGYLVLTIQLAVVLICYWCNRRAVEPIMVRVMGTVPCVVLLLGVCQMAYPDHLLNGTIAGLVDLIIFISFQNRSIEQDSLTGIGNRKSFFGELSLRIAGEQHCQIILVGLQQFARINRQYGHGSGDTLLFQMARRLDQLPGGVRAFRFGNVEFALIRPIRQEGDEEEYLGQISNLFRQEWHLGKNHSPIRIQARTVEVRYEGQDWKAEQIIEYLEYTLRLAKEEQKEIAQFTGEVAAGYQRQMYLIQTMQKAIQEHRFQVWYQPIYHRSCGRFASAEALLRLSDGQGRAISPGEFIPLAEQAGLIDDLSWIVLEEVCCLMGEGAVPGLKYVTVNLSMNQLSPDLPQRIHRLLERYGAKPQQLKLEITERQLMEDAVYAREMMEQMAQEELRFYLDDFGTGYSNLSCALDLPFQGIKLDRSLMSGLTDDPKRKLIAETLIPLFHKLGLEVVAEGIELGEQASRVLEYGVDGIQGFYYAKPMPRDQFVELFEKQSAQEQKDRKD